MALKRSSAWLGLGLGLGSGPGSGLGLGLGLGLGSGVGVGFGVVSGLGVALHGGTVASVLRVAEAAHVEPLHELA